MVRPRNLMYAAFLDVDTFDFERHVGLLYRDKEIARLSGLEAYMLGLKLVACAYQVDKTLPKDKQT
jgi:hypothetical protein